MMKMNAVGPKLGKWLQRGANSHYQCQTELFRCTRPLSTSSDPFYGRPRSDEKSMASLVAKRVAIAVHSATAAYMDPTRADAVASLAEITGTSSLKRMRREIMSDPVGSRILLDKPIVSKATIPFESLMDQAKSIPMDDDNITFGQAYGKFLLSHDFDPDARDQVRHIPDEDLAYVMLRYRQCHDYWHTLTGLPPTVVGELGLKWLELFQTGLPVAALSSTVGSLRLNSDERDIVLNHYLPWAFQESKKLSTSLMNVYYEEEFDTPLGDLRSRLNLIPAPKFEVGSQ